jgi:hypothetical protein
MVAPSAPELLRIWERSYRRAPVQRALELLAAAYPERSAESLADLSIGQRDARLLLLRERLFGPQMNAVLECPKCKGNVELNLTPADVRADAALPPPEELSLSMSGFEVCFRVPTSRDVLETGWGGDPARERQMILERCVLSVRREGMDATCDELPAELMEALAERMAEADPLAEVRLAISCPVCDHRWKVIFDIVSFLWSEIEAWGVHVLREVHALAMAYGWNEREILGLSAARRQFYLEMVQA